MMQEMSDGSLSTVDDGPYNTDIRPASRRKGGPGWTTSVEQMQQGDGNEMDSIENMRRTMRCCMALGVVMAAVVVGACVMLYDNIGMGPDVRGFATGHDPGRLSGLSPVPDMPRGDHGDEEMKRRIKMHRHVKSILQRKAFQLAQKDAIDEVAETYAPSAWFADHKHPEKAAMLHVVNSRRDADKLVDQVTGQLIDPHYKGKANPRATWLKQQYPKLSQRKYNNMAESVASEATAHALSTLSHEVGKQWVDHGLGEHGSGWLYKQVASEGSGAPKIGEGSGGADEKGGEASRSRRRSVHRHEVGGSGVGNQGTRESRQGGGGGGGGDKKGGLSLPGLGGASDVSSAAKALRSLASKSKASEGIHGRGVHSSSYDDDDDDDDDDGSEGRGKLHVLGRGVKAGDGDSWLSFGKESHTLHQALSSKGLEDRGAGDLHRAMSRGLPEKGAGGGDLSTSDGNDDDDVFSMDVDRRESGGSDSRERAGEGGGAGESHTLHSALSRARSSGDDHAGWVSQHTIGSDRGPIGTDAPKYMGKANQGFMNAAGAWGAGA